MKPRPPLPTFVLETARLKVKAAEDAWNSRNPARVALAYTEKTEWRNRSGFLKGRAQVVEFQQRKWMREHDYRLHKEPWAFTDDRIAVRFEYKFHDDARECYHAYGNENSEFDANGLMQHWFASLNDLHIAVADRKIRWERPSPSNIFPWSLEQ